MTLSTLAGALAQLVAAALTGLCAGEFLIARGRGADASESGRPRPFSRDRPEALGMGAPERALVAVAGFVGFAAALMVGHIVTGGAVFGLPGIVPAAAVALLWRQRALLQRFRPRLSVTVALLATALAALFVAPVLVVGSGLRTGDAPWHGGWTEQLLAGDPVPTGPAPVYGANAYPWGWHAVAATMVRLVPTTSAPVAAEALHVALVGVIPLAGAVLARQLRRDAGWWGAAAIGLIGGFGWLEARTPTFVSSPEEARFGADLVVASPNALYELFPPALPRELGLVLLASAGLLAVVASARGGRRAALQAGVATGLVGLVSVPLFLSACLWSLAAAVLAPRNRLRLAAGIGAAAVATFALWAGPAVADYLRFGGFVDVTPELGREWPIVSALGSWGLLIPLAAAGVVLALLRRGGDARFVLAWLGLTFALLVAARARAAFEWDLAGNATVLHQGRVWPVAHLLGAAFAGAALAWGYGSVARRSRPAAIAGAVAVLGCGLASPALASVGLQRLIQAHEEGFIYARPDVAEGSFVRRAAARLGPEVSVAVRGPRALALLLWQFSGAKLATYDDPRLARNDLRIRFRELAAAWDARMARGGFEADYEVVAARPRPSGRILEEGAFDGRRWVLINRGSRARD